MPISEVACRREAPTIPNIMVPHTAIVSYVSRYFKLVYIVIEAYAFHGTGTGCKYFKCIVLGWWR